MTGLRHKAISIPLIGQRRRGNLAIRCPVEQRSADPAYT